MGPHPRGCGRHHGGDPAEGTGSRPRASSGRTDRRGRGDAWYTWEGGGVACSLAAGGRDCDRSHVPAGVEGPQPRGGAAVYPATRTAMRRAAGFSSPNGLIFLDRAPVEVAGALLFKG